MWRVFWWSLGIASVLSVFLIWTSAQSTFLFHHPRTKGVRVEIDGRTGAAVVMAKAAEFKAAAAAFETARADAKRPRVDLAEKEFDFGIMDPLTMGRHGFIVKNIGAGPLSLKVGATTCKCTIGGLDKSSVLPGEQATVTIEWNTGRDLLYSHGATIQTNDPERKKFELWITGKVRASIAAETPEFVVGQIAPDEAKTAETLLYSQVFSSFTVQDLEFQTPGLVWKVEPLDPAVAKHLEATAAAKLSVTVPQDLPKGTLHDPLRLHVAAQKEDGAEHVQQFVLPLQGQVLGRVSYYGPDLRDNAVDFGTVPFGVTKTAKVLVKVRDSQLDLGEVQIETYPKLLQARLVPHSGGEGKGLYELHVELPAGTAPCAYRGSPQGFVRVVTSHPRIPQLELHVRFAVLDKPSL